VTRGGQLPHFKTTPKTKTASVKPLRAQSANSLLGLLSAEASLRTEGLTLAVSEFSQHIAEDYFKRAYSVQSGKT
jgi:hypothetical protein